MSCRALDIVVDCAGVLSDGICVVLDSRAEILGRESGSPTGGLIHADMLVKSILTPQDEVEYVIKLCAVSFVAYSMR